MSKIIGTRHPYSVVRIPYPAIKTSAGLRPVRRTPYAVRRTRGFSLIELVLVITLTSIAVGALVRVMGELAVQSQTAQVVSLASNLARERMEEVLADRYTFATGFDSFVEGDYPNEIPVADFETYERRVEIDYVDLADLEASVGGPTNYKRVRVSVDHSEIGKVTISTILSRR